jgi:hypothetical protein
MFCLLETRLRGLDSRTHIREQLSRIKSPRNHTVSPEGLGASRLPSFTRRLAREDRCFFAPLLSEAPLGEQRDQPPRQGNFVGSAVGTGNTANARGINAFITSVDQTNGLAPELNCPDATRTLGLLRMQG